MRLYEFAMCEDGHGFNTLDPKLLMRKIIDNIKTQGRNDCHGTCAKAIGNGNVNDDDIVIILGPVGDNMGTHSIIVSPEKDIKVDLWHNKLQSYDKDGIIVKYKKLGDTLGTLNPKLMSTVASLKKSAGV